MLCVFRRFLEYRGYCFIAACSVPLNLPDLPDTVSCSVSKTCTGVTCCVYSEEVGRNFQVSVEIDTCARTITVELEQVKFEIPFEEYLWGRSSLIDMFIDPDKEILRA